MLIKICLQRAVSQIPRGSSLSLTPMEMNHQIINSTFCLALPSFISAVLSKLFCWVVRTENFWTVSEWFLEKDLLNIATDVVLHDFASCGSSEIVSIFSGGWKHSGVGRSPTAITSQSATRLKTKLKKYWKGTNKKNDKEEKTNDVIFGRNPTAISKSICHTTQNIFQMKKNGERVAKKRKEEEEWMIEFSAGAQQQLSGS